MTTPQSSDAASGWYPVKIGQAWRIARDYWLNIGAGTYPDYKRGESGYVEYPTIELAQRSADLLNR